jgi:uridine phosphorylase
MTHKAYHLEIDPEHMEGNGGLGRYVFLPGSPKRAARMAERFTDGFKVSNSRQLDSHYGKLVRGDLAVDVAVVPTGMGTPSVDIVVWELMQIGARRFLRVGTTGTLQPHVKGGDVVIATAAVRDTGCPDAYAPREFPAAGDPVMVEVYSAAARRLGQGDRVHAGLVHTKDSFFGREYGQGPYGERNREYMQHLVRANVLATEMEAGQLFVMGTVFGGAPSTVSASRTAAVPMRCGALLAVIGDMDGFFGPEVAHETEGRMLELAMEGTLDLAEMELQG